MSSPAKWAALGAAAAFVVAAVLHKIEKRSESRKEVTPESKVTKPYSEELVREQLARNYAFLTEEGMEKVRSQRIVVVGCGGVGSWVIAMLVRSGVGTIRMVDFDQVSLSSLNRHAVANLSDVGRSKVECLFYHLNKVAPWVDIQTRNQLWNLQAGEDLIFGDNFKPTLVVDCIDNIDTKVDLLAFCHNHNVPVISSGGAACKSDPTRINIADILKTEEDPLARSVRIRLMKRGIVESIPVVFSAEKPDPRKAKLLPLNETEVEKGDINELSAMKNFRVRILPVLGTMPGMFGLALSTHIITNIAGYPTEYVEGKNRIKFYDGILQSLAGQQARIGHLDQRTPIATKDVPYIVEEVFRGKSVVSNYSTRLTLSRWRPDEELSFQNIVVLTKDEQRNHEEKVLKSGAALEDVYREEVIKRAEARFAQERYYSTFR